MPRHFTEDQRAAIAGVTEQLNVLWKKTATRERKLRLDALRLFATSLASGKAEWKVNEAERELGAFLVETKISQWLTLYVDDDGEEHVGIYSFPEEWSRKGKEPARASRAEASPESPSELERLVNEVRGLK